MSTYYKIYFKKNIIKKWTNGKEKDEYEIRACIF